MGTWCSYSICILFILDLVMICKCSDQKCPMVKPCFCKWSEAFNRNGHEIHCESSNIHESMLPKLVSPISKNVKLEDFTMFNLSNNYIDNDANSFTAMRSIFLKLTGLKILDLSKNGFSQFPSEIISLSALTELNLGSNSIGRNFEGLSLGTKVSKIKKIDLSQNQIDSIPENLFYGLKQLTSLYMKNNNIKNWMRGTFNRTPNLLVLDLSFNKISKIDQGMFEGLSMLTYLNLKNNQLMYLETEVLEDLPMLTGLNLGTCGIRYAQKDAFANTPDLSHILLSQNKLKLIPNLSDLKSLELLSLISNRITKFNKEAFGEAAASLLSLYLDHNDIHHLEKDAFSNFKNLKKLSISLLPITTLPDLSHLSNLERLDIRSTHISTIYQCQLQGPMKANFNSLFWSHSPIQCDCNINWLKEWSLSLSAEKYKETAEKWICSEPSRLSKMPLTETNANELACEGGLSSSYCTSAVSLNYHLNVSIVQTDGHQVQCKWHFSSKHVDIKHTLLQIFLILDHYDFHKNEDMLNSEHKQMINSFSFPEYVGSATLTNLRPDTKYLLCISLIGSDQNLTIVHHCEQVSINEHHNHIMLPSRLRAPVGIGTVILLGLIITLVILCLRWNYCSNYRRFGRGSNIEQNDSNGISNMAFGIELNLNNDT